MSGIIAILILLGLIGLAVNVVESISQFVGSIPQFIIENPVIIVIIGIIVILIIIEVYLTYQEKLLIYKSIELITPLNLSDKEKYLLMAAITVLDQRITVFSPHDLAVKGVDTTYTYYKNLYDKGYFDRYYRGQYSLNITMLEKAVNQYMSEINYRIGLAKKSKLKKQAKQTIENYEADKLKIRLYGNRYVTYKSVSEYINRKKQIEARRF